MIIIIANNDYYYCFCSWFKSLLNVDAVVAEIFNVVWLGMLGITPPRLIEFPGTTTTADPTHNLIVYCCILVPLIVALPGMKKTGCFGMIVWAAHRHMKGRCALDDAQCCQHKNKYNAIQKKDGTHAWSATAFKRRFQEYLIRRFGQKECHVWIVIFILFRHMIPGWL